jgi:hypothetical protein
MKNSKEENKMGYISPEYKFSYSGGTDIDPTKYASSYTYTLGNSATTPTFLHYKCKSCNYEEDCTEEPNFCRQCGKPIKYQLPFKLEKPTLIDVDKTENERIAALNGYGLQDSVFVRSCGTCKHSPDVVQTTTFQCGLYNGFKIDTSNRNSKKCECWSNDKYKECPVCHYLFSAYDSENNCYDSERECPICHKFKRVEYVTKKLSFKRLLGFIGFFIVPIIWAILNLIFGSTYDIKFMSIFAIIPIMGYFFVTNIENIPLKQTTYEYKWEQVE